MAHGKFRQKYGDSVEPSGHAGVDLQKELERLVRQSAIKAGNTVSMIRWEEAEPVERTYKSRKRLTCDHCHNLMKKTVEPYRQGDRTLCTQCVRQHEWLVSWAQQGYHATKLYCAECGRLFRSIHKKAGRPHDYCSLRCSNTARTRARREREESQKREG